MKKKFLSSLLALCMVLSMLPVTAFAANATDAKATYNAATGALVITAGSTDVLSAGTADVTKVTIKDTSTGTVALTKGATTVSEATTASFTATIAGTDKTAVDKILVTNEATYKVTLAADYAGTSAGTEIADIPLTVSGIPVAPAATLDYATEKVTGVADTMEYVIDTTAVGTGAETYAAFTAAELGISASVPANAVASNYIHIRTKAADPVPAGLIQDIEIKARPETPTYGIDYAKETTNKAVATADQYSSSVDMTTPEDGDGSTTVKLTLNANLYFRTKATVTAFASAVQTLTVPARPAAPTDATGVTISKGTAVGTIGLSGATTLEYKITTSAGTAASVDAAMRQNWTACTVSANDSTSTAIIATDKVWVRNAATASAFASAAAATSIEVKAADIGKAKSADATITTASTIKGVSPTSLGTPAATIDGVTTAGTLTLTAAAAADTTGTAATAFTPTHANATVKAVKYASGTTDLSGFGSAAAYNNEAITTGDFFIIKVTAEDGTTVNYYKIVVTVEAALDTTAPKLTATSASDITATGANLKFTSDEAGTYYYLVLATADATPTAATVKAQGEAVAKGTASASAAANTVAVTGLTASTAYKAYVIVADAATNLSAVATIEVTTAALAKSAKPTFDSAGNTFTMTSADLTVATYTLSTAPANTTYAVYDASTGGSVSTVASVTAKDTTLTLTLTTAPTENANYYISATETGKTESDRVGVMIKAYVKSTDATITASGTKLGTVAITGTFTGGVIGTPSALTVTLPAGTTSGNLVLKVDAGATVKYVKAATAADDATITGTTTNESGTVTQNLTGIANGDAYIIGVTAENGTTKLYYKLTITVTPADIADLTITVNPTTGVVTGDTAGEGSALAYYLVTATKQAVIDTWNVETTATAAATAIAGTEVASKRAMTFADNGKFLVVVKIANSKVVAAGESAVIAVDSPFKITEIGAESDDGAGKVRTITCTGSFTNEYLVIQMTEGTGAAATVSVVMVKAADSVAVSYKTTAKVQAWITDGMPKLNGGGATNATIYDTLTATTSAAENHA